MSWFTKLYTLLLSLVLYANSISARPSSWASINTITILGSINNISSKPLKIFQNNLMTI